jgi:hypothetical protein
MFLSPFSKDSKEDVHILLLGKPLPVGQRWQMSTGLEEVERHDVSIEL